MNESAATESEVIPPGFSPKPEIMPVESEGEDDPTPAPTPSPSPSGLADTALS